MSDMGNGTYDMIINGQTGQVSAIKELALNTSYIHRFNPNWRSTVEIGVGFYNKPSAAAGFTNCANSGSTIACVSGGTNAAQLSSVEKRHMQSSWSLTYSPVPGMMDIVLEWDHWERWVQASSTSGHGNGYGLNFNFYW